MTRQAAAGGRRRGRAGAAAAPSTSTETNVGLLLVTGDRGLAGGFNSQIIRAGVRLSAELAEEGLQQQLVRDRAPRRLLADASAATS